MNTWYLLDSSFECIAILDPTLPRGFAYEEDVLTEQLSFSTSSLEFKVATSHAQAKKIKAQSMILYQGKERKELFSVIETEEDGKGYLHIWCEPVYVKELNSLVVRPATLKSVTLKQAMQPVLMGSGWVIRKSELSGARDISFTEPMTALEAIHEITHSFQAEIQFFIEMNGFQITKKSIHLLHKRGKRINRPIVFDEERMELKKRVEQKECITALIGIGSQKEDGSFLTFQEYTPPKANGLEKKEDWVGDLAAKERWGKHFFGVYRDEKAQNPVELYRNTVRELRRRIKPHISYTLQLSGLDDLKREVRIGDTLFIQIEKGKKPIYLRVIERKTSLTNPEQNSITAEKG